MQFTEREVIAVKTLAFVALFFIAIVGLTWAVEGNDFALYKFFAPKQEAVRRQVFEESKAYNQGMIQELQNMQFEYLKTDKDHQQALAGIILHRAADYDENKLPSDLRQFIQSLRDKQAVSQ